MNRKAQALVGFFIILFLILGVFALSKISTKPSPKGSKDNPILLNYSNFTINNTSNITNFSRINLNKTITVKNKTKYYIPNQTLYPNPYIVTGDILNYNKTEICVSGYSSTVRDVPLSLRKRVFARDGITYPPNKSTDYELDHFYALENGGSNDISNLFVENAPYYHWKDKVENLVHDVFCNPQSEMSVQEANNLMWIWYDIYQNNSIVYDYQNMT